MLASGVMETSLTLKGVSWRHKVRDASSWKPWAKKDGPGIHSIDLEIQKGTILGLIGPNGAGKTTLMRAICGLYDCEGFDKSCTSRRTGIGYMPEQIRWEGRVSVRSSLQTISLMRDEDIDLDGIIETVGLSSKSEHFLDDLSQGMRQRLSLACALIGEPKILVMDEPLNGLDPLAQRAFCNLLKSLSSKGVAVVISSHQVSDLESFVDRIALLHHGQLLAEGTLPSIRQNLGLKDSAGIVEMICSVTGIEPEDVSLELSNDDLLPFKQHGGEEE
jgi:ABC-type multidrug transport system ATPase subunit|tara:strand:+ start:3943 stop:4767 length:825 start_codon:yes stop_codon:yes gene_type:complete